MRPPQHGEGGGDSVERPEERSASRRVRDWRFPLLAGCLFGGLEGGKRGTGIMQGYGLFTAREAPLPGLIKMHSNCSRTPTPATLTKILYSPGFIFHAGCWQRGW